MLRNFLKIATRNLVRHKVFSLINILGLGLGMACSLLIMLWVQDELRYDTFHARQGQLFKVIVHQKEKDGSMGGSMDATPGLLAEALQTEVPEITHATLVSWEQNQLLTVGQKTSREKGRNADADFFAMFTFPLLAGNPRQVLDAPDKIVISRKLARNYFGRESPMGKTVRIDNKRDFQVSGVFADVPENSSLRFDYVIALKPFFDDNQWVVSGWGHFGPPTFVMLRKGASLERVNAKIRNFLPQHDPTVDDQVLSLQPYQDSYLYSRFTKGIADGGRIDYVRLFSLIAVFIVLIACINFMNLSTALSIKRAKEVGVRKVVGASKGFLFGQFMGEAVLTTGLGVVLAIGVAWLCLPTFNSLTEKHLSLPLGHPVFLLTLLALTLATSFIAGSYPALFLSSLHPIEVLKGGGAPGTLKFKSNAGLFRKGLVVFQFALSILLIVCTAIVYRQMNFVQTKNLGLDRENIVYIPLEGDLSRHYQAFRQDIMRSGVVQEVTQAGTIPTQAGMWSDNLDWKGKDPNEKVGFVDLPVGYDFIKTMKIALKSGRDFSPAFGTDSANYLINETAARLMKLDNPVGETFTHAGHQGTIIGVMKDFHMFSLHQPIAPIFISFQTNFQWGVAIVRTQPGKTREALTTLEQASKKYNPKYPFDYLFADEMFQQQYKSETMVGQLAAIFTSLAIFISCLGLFGSAMFTAQQRTKEIGIRKVLGASVTNIAGLLSKDFLRLVLFANLLAWPLAYYTMNRWLQDFAYRVGISWWIFALAGLSALAIALLTVSFQAVKAALANPVKSLRTE